MTPNPDTAPDNACPLDLSDWTPDAIIIRWREAFRRANGRDPDDPVSYERGWFVFRSGALNWIKYRHRRKEIAAFIWRLENRAPCPTDAKTTGPR